MNDIWKELIGYLAPVFIVLSMMQSNVKKIRLLMIAGCVVFVVYGVLVEAWPVTIANLMIGSVTLFYFIRARDVEHRFSLMEASSASTELVKEFFETYKKDLLLAYPHAEHAALQRGADLLFLMKGLEPVGLFCFRKIEQETVEILIDYVVEAYRDVQTEQFLYSANEGHLAKQGFHKVIMHSEISAVKQEMKKMGFQEQEPGILTKIIS
jgi:hypothetical protein